MAFPKIGSGVAAACLLAAGGAPVGGAVEFAGFLNPGESEPLVFAAFGDCGDRLTNSQSGRVASMVKAWRPDFIVGLGDLNYGSTMVGAPDWDIRIASRYGDYILGRADGRYPLQTGDRQRFYPVVGNHDTSVGGLGGGDVRGYVDYFVRDAEGMPDRLPAGSGVHGRMVSYYDFVIRDVHVVVADSDLGRVSPGFAEAQNAWIGDTLRRSGARWKFLVMHHPAYSSDAVHGSQQWMQGPHLHEADAVFAGHAHVYERLDVDGTPFFTAGTGGRPPYSFRAEVLPESRFRASVAPVVYGSLRVTVAGEGVRIEYVTIDDGAGGSHGGRTFDSIELGEFSEVVNVAEFPVETVAGQALAIRTSTPEGGDGDELLDPLVELVTPGGAVIATASDGAGDGRNVAMEHVATDAGRYLVRVKPEGGTRGRFTVEVSAEPALPAEPVEVWRVQQFGEMAGFEQALDSGDLDADGLDNLTEYAFGTSPVDPADPPQDGRQLQLIHAPQVTAIEFVLREGVRQDLAYAIEATSSFGGVGGWAPVAERLPGSSWQGTVQVVESPGEGRAVVVRVTDDRQYNLARSRYYRLAVRRVEM